MPTTQPTLLVSSASPSLVEGPRTLVGEHGPSPEPCMSSVCVSTSSGASFETRETSESYKGSGDGVARVETILFFTLIPKRFFLPNQIKSALFRYHISQRLECIYSVPVILCYYFTFYMTIILQSSLPNKVT